MDKNKIHIDDWIQNTLSNETDNENIHQSWEKMSALLDENDIKPKSAFWFGSNGMFSILFVALLTTISGIAFWNNNNNSADIIDNTITSETNQNVMNLQEPQALVSNNIDSDNNSVKSDDPYQKAIDHSNQIVKNDKLVSDNYTKPTTRNKPKNLASNTSTQSTDIKTNTQQITSTLPNNQISNPDNNPIENNSTQLLLASNSTDINTNDLLKKYNIDSLKKVIDSDIKNKNIAYSTKNQELGRVKKIDVTEIHKIVEYPEISQDNNTPKETVVSTLKSTKIKLIPLSEVEEFIIQSLQVELEPAANSDEDIRFLEIVNSEINRTMLASASSDMNSTDMNKNRKDINSGSILTDINNYFNFRKNLYSTLNMGFNSTPGDWLPFGFQFGVGAHYYISNRFTLGLSGIYSFRNTNFSISDNKSVLTLLRTGHSGTSTYFDYEDKSTDRQYNVRYLESFQFPLLLTYHTQKFSYSAGPVIAFSSNIKYNKNDKENIVERRLVMPDSVEAFPLMSHDYTYNENNFRRNMLLGFNAGVQYNINENVGIYFKYAQLFWDNGKNDNVHSIMKQTFKTPEFRLGIQYRIGNPKRVQYMLMPSGR